jgi:hypothetical protein
MEKQDRFFQRGDEVRFINRGRPLPKPFKYDKTYIVTRNETETGLVAIEGLDFSSFFLELVGPVEKNFPFGFQEAVKYMMEGHILERISPVRIAIIQIRVTENQVQGRLKGFTDEKSWSIYSLDYEDFQSRWRLVD